MSLRYVLVFFCALSLTQAFQIRNDYENMIDSGEEDRLYSENLRMHIIFPGTKWCGTGTIAANYSDLGPAVKPDMCCRDHDYCDDIIESGETKHNLTNNSFYTRLNCKCDLQFLNCLKANKDKISSAVGNMYFNVLGTECYKYDYPIVKCIKHHMLTRRCLEYQLNKAAPKIWEWFDVPIY